MTPLTTPTTSVNVSIPPPGSRTSSVENGRGALDRPERGNGSDHVGRRARPSDGLGQRRAAPSPNAAEHGRDEQELTELDADVEEQQRDRHRVLRQADLGERAGEAETVQEPERERD